MTSHDGAGRADVRGPRLELPPKGSTAPHVARLPLLEVANVATFLGLAPEYIAACMEPAAPRVDLAEEIALEIEKAGRTIAGRGYHRISSFRAPYSFAMAHAPVRDRLALIRQAAADLRSHARDREAARCPKCFQETIPCDCTGEPRRDR